MFGKVSSYKLSRITLVAICYKNPPGILVNIFDMPFVFFKYSFASFQSKEILRITDNIMQEMQIWKRWLLPYAVDT